MYGKNREKATRNNKRGKAMEKMIMGITKKIMEKGTKRESVKKEIMMGKVRNGKERWRIIKVYV